MELMKTTAPIHVTINRHKRDALLAIADSQGRPLSRVTEDVLDAGMAKLGVQVHGLEWSTDPPAVS
jgi:hypothetical protein